MLLDSSGRKIWQQISNFSSQQILPRLSFSLSFRDDGKLLETQLEDFLNKRLIVMIVRRLLFIPAHHLFVVSPNGPDREGLSFQAIGPILSRFDFQLQTVFLQASPSIEILVLQLTSLT